MHIIKSFVKRTGRKISNSKLALSRDILPNYLFKQELIPEDAKKISLEIGFGKGEHLCNQALCNPDSFYIGSEIFEHGIISATSYIKEHNLRNILIWPDDVDVILRDMPNDYLFNIFILFPDPWTKRKHCKRRFLQDWRIKIMLDKLQKGRNIYFASDIADYIAFVQDVCQKLGVSYITSEDPLHLNYQNTRYHNKALLEGRRVQFMAITK
jgi:release factor glutamine methyltransferase